jgi:hypothetical protein
MPDYDKILPNLEKGMVGNTYRAFDSAITNATSQDDLVTACEDLRDLCLIISFLNGCCVTPSGSAPGSVVQFFGLGDGFVPPRAIRGFPSFTFASPISGTLHDAFKAFQLQQKARRLRLFLFHWINGLTCYTLEDCFLSLCVQFDIIKQCEISARGKGLGYFQGVTTAGKRFGLAPLTKDFVKMRNDIVHEGQLSGSNFAGKTKAECAQVIVDALNWLDAYVIAVLGIKSCLAGAPRVKPGFIAHALPAFTVRN